MAEIWIWAPVVRGPLYQGDMPGYHVQLNGPTTVNPLTGTVDPPTDPVDFTSLIVENRDGRSPTYGHCFVKHAKALIDERDRARCTNEVAERDVPREDRLMVELAQLEGKTIAIEAVFAREKAAATVISADGKDMADRLVTQMRYRRLPTAAEDRIRASLDLEVTPREL